MIAEVVEGGAAFEDGFLTVIEPVLIITTQYSQFSCY